MVDALEQALSEPQAAIGNPVSTPTVQLPMRDSNDLPGRQVDATTDLPTERIDPGRVDQAVSMDSQPALVSPLLERAAAVVIITFLSLLSALLLANLLGVEASR